MNGVTTRIVVWRHRLSYVTRYLFLGEVSIEAEAAKMEKRCHLHGVAIRVVNTNEARVKNKKRTKKQ